MTNLGRIAPNFEKSMTRVYCLLPLVLGACHVLTPDPIAPSGGSVHHVALVWLKQAGDPAARRQYIELSRPLENLPGVLSYRLGTPLEVRRERASTALDKGYDVAVSATFADPDALEAFLKNPDYQTVAQQQLRPLVDKYKVYEFAE